MWPIFRRRRTLLVFLSCCFLVLFSSSTHAWEWSDWIGSGNTLLVNDDTLSLQQVSEMRVRDLKRRLARHHGYGADELARMLDKKELIHALAYEEYKVHQAHVAQAERILIKRGIVLAVICVLVVLCWPLLTHLYDVIQVNFVVYTDRKRHEATKCWEFQSTRGTIGIVVMAILDLLGIWLTVTVLLSWIMSTNSPYFFPIPSLVVRPAQFMGGPVASGPLSRYGINTGPMLITWLLRYLHGYTEQWVGRCLAQARQGAKKARRKSKKNQITPQEAEAKRAAKAARRAAREQTKQQSNPQPPELTKPQTSDTKPQQDYLQQQEEHTFAEKGPSNTEPQQQASAQKQQPEKETTPKLQKQNVTHKPKERNGAILQEQDKVEQPPIQLASQDEKRNAAAAAAEARWNEWNRTIQDDKLDTHTAFDDLD